MLNFCKSYIQVTLYVILKFLHKRCHSQRSSFSKLFKSLLVKNTMLKRKVYVETF